MIKPARPTPSLVISMIALFVALSGTAVALDGSNTVFSDDIVDGEVRNSDIGANAVGSGQINDGAVRSGDIRDGAVQGPDIDANAVANPELASRSVGFLELQFDSVHTSNVMDDTLRGRDVNDGSLTGDDLAAGSVASDEVVDASLNAPDLGNDSVDSGEITDGAVHRSELAIKHVEGPSQTVIGGTAHNAEWIGGKAEASCGAGWTPIAGGAEWDQTKLPGAVDSPDELAISDIRVFGRRIEVWGRNDSGVDYDLTPWATCINN